MNDVIAKLNERKEYLNDLVVHLKGSIACAPRGKLRITSKAGKPQYYLKTVKGDYNGRYIPRNQMYKAVAIAQRDYEKDTLEAALNELQAIDDLINAWMSGRIEDTYGKLILPRKELVTPVTMTDEEYAENWLNKQYTPKGFKSSDPEIYSSSGQRVRSKSEALLLDNFDHFKVPCRFECPVRLWDGRVIYPDFTLLNIRTRLEFLWEHFGKADDPAYMRTNVERLNDLILSGYIPGLNLIVSFETLESPLNQKMVQTYIRQYLI